MFVWLIVCAYGVSGRLFDHGFWSQYEDYFIRYSRIQRLVE